jgi:hypothetical protein
MRRATSIAGLGAGFDGEPAEIAYGAGQRARLRWDATAGAWLSAPRTAIRFRDLVAFRHAASGAAWGYMSLPQLANSSTASQDLGYFDPLKPYGWHPRAVLDATAAYAAGLKLQNRLGAVFWGFAAGSNFDLGLVWYELGPGDAISPSIDPNGHVGAALPSVATVRCMTTTAWVDAPIPTPVKASAVLAPHFYTRDNLSSGGNAYAESALARWRWKGTP